MLSKIDKLINIITGSFIGVFIGRSLYTYWHYTKHTELYIVNSAPWYTGIIVNGIFTVVIIVVAVIAKIVMKRIIKNRN